MNLCYCTTKHEPLYIVELCSRVIYMVYYCWYYSAAGSFSWIMCLPSFSPFLFPSEPCERVPIDLRRADDSAPVIIAWGDLYPCTVVSDPASWIKPFKRKRAGWCFLFAALTVDTAARILDRELDQLKLISCAIVCYCCSSIRLSLFFPLFYFSFYFS